MKKFISTVDAKNVKGLDFTHQLDTCTVFIGDNMTGKTAVLDAIRIGLRGTHPALPRTNAGTFTLAGSNSPSMSVELVIGNQIVKRKWMQKADGSVANPINDSPFAVPDVALDPSAYFGMKKADRIGYIASLADWTHYGYSDERLIEKIQAIEVPVQGQTLLDNALKNANHRIAMRKKKGTPVPVWMDEFIAELTDDLKAAKGANRGLPGLHNIPMPSGGKPLDTSEQIKTVSEQVDRLKIDLRAIGSDVGGAERLLAAWRRTLTDAIKARDDAFAEDDRLKPIAEELPKLKERGAAIAAEAKELNQKIAAQESMISNIKGNLAGLDELDEPHPECPRCKTGGKKWLAILAREREEAAKQKAVLEKEMDAAVAALEEASTRHSDLMDEDIALDDKVGAAAHAEMERQVIARRLPELKANAERATRECEAAFLAHKTAIENQDKRAVIDEELKAKEATLAELRATREKFTQWTNIKTQRDNIEKRILDGDRSVQFLVDQIAALVALQKEIVDACFNDVLGKARLFTDGIIGGDLAYQDGDFGMIRTDGQWVNHEVMSRTEQTLAYAGFCVALAQDSPLKIVIIDELGVIRDHRKKTVIERMNKLITDGTIDQFIGVDVDGDIYELMVERPKLIYLEP